MAKTQYELRRTGTVEMLSSIPHDGGQLDMALFGPNTYYKNVGDMENPSLHSKNLPTIFTPATTSESISAAIYDLENADNPKIFDPNWLQAGLVFKSSEWVVINPPRSKQGYFVTDEKNLKSILNEAVKINGIYRVPNGKIESVRDCSFVPYDSFRQGVQSSEDFARSGLARGLEYVEGGEAPKLKMISANGDFARGIKVFGFDREDGIRVAWLFSNRGIEDNRLSVCGNGWWDCDVGSSGFAFGVLKKSA